MSVQNEAQVTEQEQAARLQQARGAAAPDWPALTDEELAAYQARENALRSSPEARAITGTPHAGAQIEWQELDLPGRRLPVRVYRPTNGQTAPTIATAGASADPDAPLPLVVHVHGGGFVGTAVQSDWINSHLAAQLPALVVSVEHRLLGPSTPLADAVADGWDALEHLVLNAEAWGFDPARVAVIGESCGGLIMALAAIRARECGLPLRAQVLVNPAVDVTETMLEHASAAEYAQSPTLSVGVLQLFQRLAVPAGVDPRTLSPLHTDDLGALPTTLVVVPTHDPVADHGRLYAECLAAAGTSAKLSEYTGAPHAFLSMPGVVPQAEPAREEITAFLRGNL